MWHASHNLTECRMLLSIPNSISTSRILFCNCWTRMLDKLHIESGRQNLRKCTASARIPKPSCGKWQVASDQRLVFFLFVRLVIPTNELCLDLCKLLPRRLPATSLCLKSFDFGAHKLFVQPAAELRKPDRHMQHDKQNK